jgi:hypothetical protein
MFVSYSLSLSLSLLQFCLYRSSLIESCRKSYKEQSQILSKHVQPDMSVTLSSFSEFVFISLSLTIYIYIYKSLSWFVQLNRNVPNPKCLFHSLHLSLSPSLSLSLTLSLYLTLYLSLLQFCLDLSSLIESSRKQILLRKSYREQSQANSFAQVLSSAVANPLESSGESCLIVCFSLSLSVYLTLSLSHMCLFKQSQHRF